VAPIGREGLQRLIEMIVDRSDERVPPLTRACLRLLVTQLQLVNAQALETDRQIKASARSTEVGRRLMEIPGVGPVLASAIVAAVADPGAFHCGRNLAAWIGLVPRQNSSGGKDRLGGISKQGHRYLRQMLVVGAMAVIRYAQGMAPVGRGWRSCWHGARRRSLRSRSPTRRRASSGRS
jgi:transposase